MSISSNLKDVSICQLSKGGPEGFLETPHGKIPPNPPLAKGEQPETAVPDMAHVWLLTRCTGTGFTKQTPSYEPLRQVVAER
jgi:hypothetical protein